MPATKLIVVRTGVHGSDSLWLLPDQNRRMREWVTVRLYDKVQGAVLILSGTSPHVVEGGMVLGELILRDCNLFYSEEALDVKSDSPQEVTDRFWEYVNLQCEGCGADTVIVVCDAELPTAGIGRLEPVQAYVLDLVVKTVEKIG